MKFIVEDMWVEYSDGAMSGHETLVSLVQQALDSKDLCGCNYWGEIPASIDTPWQAYLTICGAIQNALLIEPVIEGRIPRNPDGYEPEGVVLPVDVAGAYRRLMSDGSSQ